jgi:hypothetical protein
LDGGEEELAEEATESMEAALSARGGKPLLPAMLPLSEELKPLSTDCPSRMGGEELIQGLQLRGGSGGQSSESASITAGSSSWMSKYPGSASGEEAYPPSASVELLKLMLLLVSGEPGRSQG